MAGLDPAIHLVQVNLKLMDARIKSGHDVLRPDNDMLSRLPHALLTLLLLTLAPTVHAQTGPTGSRPKSAASPAATDQTSSRTAEPFEGRWAKTKEECSDDESPTSRTTIDLTNMDNGKPAPIIDRYENHCLINGRVASGNDTTLSVTCYEFWDDLTKRTAGNDAKIKLTRGQKGRLMIDGISYQRCEARPTPSNTPR